MSDQPQTRPDSDPTAPSYWCYHCDKHVTVETHPDLPDIICLDCRHGFVVESLSATAPPPFPPPQTEDSVFGNQFIDVLRLIADSARENIPPPPPSEPADDGDDADDDYLRFELEGWRNDDDEDEDDDNDENVEEEENHDDDDEESQRLVLVNENQDEENDQGADDDDERRSRRVMEALHRILIGDESRGVRRHEALRLGESRRNRILDWAEILMGLEDHSIEFRLQVPEMDSYIGNPGDYVDAAGYEALLQNLAESDNGGRRGAPPAAKSAVEGLETVVIKTEGEVVLCSVCKDLVNVGENAKKMPCGHLYHGDCIVPWLGARNSCPICRFELPTDDPDYEEERKNKVNHGKGCSSSGVGVGVDGGSDGGQRREDQ